MSWNKRPHKPSEIKIIMYQIHKFLPILFLFLSCTGLMGQDVGFNAGQSVSPGLLNPALLGNTDTWRISLGHRKQLGANEFLHGHHQQFLAVEHNLAGNLDRFSIAIVATASNNDFMERYNVQLSSAYNVPLSKNHRLLFGTSIKYHQSNAATDGLLFYDQIVLGGTNSSNSAERFEDLNRRATSLGFGAAFFTNKFWSTLSVANLTLSQPVQPDLQSLLFGRKITAGMGAMLKYKHTGRNGSEIHGFPGIFYTQEGNFQELAAGFNSSVEHNANGYYSFGIWYKGAPWETVFEENRHNKLALNLGMSFNSFGFVISRDILLSSQASLINNHLPSWEIALTFEPGIKTSFSKKGGKISRGGGGFMRPAYFNMIEGQRRY